MPDNHDCPKYSADEIIDLYIENGDVIFNTSLLQEIKSVSGLVNVKYDPKGIESVFEEYFWQHSAKRTTKTNTYPSIRTIKREELFFSPTKSKNK